MSITNMTDIDILCAVQSQNVEKIQLLVDVLKEQRDFAVSMYDRKSRIVFDALDYLNSGNPETAKEVLQGDR